MKIGWASGKNARIIVAMHKRAPSSSLLIRTICAIGLGLGACTAAAICPVASELEAASLDEVERLLANHRDELAALELAQCQLAMAERLIQTRAEFALQQSKQALQVIRRFGTRLEQSNALGVQVRLRLTQGEDPELRALLEDSLELCGADRDCQAKRRLALGNFDYATKQYESARKQIEQAMTIVRAQHGDEHALLAEAMQSLSQVAYREGKYDEELALLQSAYAMQHRVLKVDDPAIATTALQFGFSLADRGRYDEALPLYQQSLAIRLDTLGENHVDTAQSMLAVGSIATLRGEYVVALTHIEKAAAIRQRLLPPGHANLATSYIQLAHLQERMGDKHGADQSYRKVLDIAQANEDSARQFIAWQGLASISLDRGDLETAKAQIQTSLTLMERQNYTSHLWESGRYMLAEIQRELGESKEALALYKEVLKERAASRPAGDAQVARCKLAVALLEVELGDAGQLVVAHQALSEAEAALGSLHPELEELQTRLALVLADQGQIEKAMAMALRALDVRMHVLAETAVGLSEAEALQYADHDIPALDLAFQLALEHPEKTSVEAIWDRQTGMRDLVLRRVAGRLAMARASADPSTESAARAMQASSDRYVRLLLLESPDGLDSTWGEQLKQARNDRNSAERELARLIPPAASLPGIPINTLRKELTGKQIIVSLTTTQRDNHEIYVAMLAGSTMKPVLIALGSVAGVNADLMRWRNSLQQGASQTADVDGPRAEEALSSQLLQPLLRRSAGAAELLMSSTGALHLLPWAALPSGEGKTLVETGPVIRLFNREADLLRPNATAAGLSAKPGSGLLALGGANFGLPPHEAMQSSCVSFGEHVFETLPGTETEIVELKEGWASWHPSEPVLTLTGNRASEARFRTNAPGKRVLHVATHAFFSDPKSCKVDTRLAVRGVGAVVARDTNDRVALAGLALSNANQRRQLNSSNDGILAAEEIAMMDLRGVELAVLSACDTGLGTLTSTEGVLGLRRAFRLAGVRNLVTSLWKVGDEDALIWMRAFYARSADPASSVGLAAWKASADVLGERRNKGLDLGPVYWAGFVASGN